MSYPSYDLTVANGSPIVLYRFVYNDLTYRYCDLDGGVPSIMANGEEYFATTIDSSNTEMTPDMAKTSLDITVSRLFPVAKLFFLAPPEGVVSITLLRTHIIDPDLGYITLFKGRVISCAFQGDEATLHCEPIFSSLKRVGLRMVYDSQCAHALYSNRCTVLKEDHQVLGSVLTAVGTAVTVQSASEHPDGWFIGGVFICGDVRRMITQHTGVNLTLMHSVSVSIITKDCVLYPGCDHTRTHCINKYNNVLNYGGFPWMPLKNPFSGDNIFW